MRDGLPKPGELLALPEGKARALFARWLRDDELSGEIAMLSFEQHSEEVRKAGWLQARWHEDGDKRGRPPAGLRFDDGFLAEMSTLSVTHRPFSRPLMTQKIMDNLGNTNAEFFGIIYGNIKTAPRGATSKE